MKINLEEFDEAALLDVARMLTAYEASLTPLARECFPRVHGAVRDVLTAICERLKTSGPLVLEIPDAELGRTLLSDLFAALEVGCRQQRCGEGTGALLKSLRAKLA